MFEIYHYRSTSGAIAFREWFNSLPDKEAQTRIAARVTRLKLGNFGDCKPLRDGVWELRVDYGPGYRLYYAKSGYTVLLLLCGGDKRRQSADISRAVAYWKDYLKRTGVS